MDLVTRTENLKRKITSNLRTNSNPSGLLIRNEKDYMDCLSISHAALKDLILKDEAHWAENLELAMQQAQELKERIAGEFEKF